MLSVNQNIEIPETEFDFSFARSGGPGGQNVNKVNSRAVLHWDVTNTESLPAGVKERFLARYRNRVTTEGVLVLQSQRYRDQGRNVADCLEKLREMICNVAMPPKRRRPTRPTRGSKQRRLKDKRVRAEKKQLRKEPKPDS